MHCQTVIFGNGEKHAFFYEFKHVFLKLKITLVLKFFVCLSDDHTFF